MPIIFLHHFFKVFLCLILLFKANHSNGQIWTHDRMSVHVGLSLQLGTHMNRIGLFAGYSLHYEYVQANILIHGHYHFNRLTQKPKGWECQLKTAILVAFGDKTKRNQPFFETLVNYTGRPYYIGYAYHLYFDTQQTSQRTGEVGLGIHGFGFRFENDFLAFESKDAYRTGGFQLSYQWNDIYIFIQNIQWTYDPYAERSETVLDDTYPSPYGYRLIRDEHVFGSWGILCAGFQYRTSFGQAFGMSVGLDMEQIRHQFQNKWMHDAAWLKNPHIPMVDQKKQQYLFQSDQSIRSPRLFYQLTANQMNLY